MKKATALKPVIYRKNKNIEDNIELQAFMQIPLSFVLKRADSILLFYSFMVYLSEFYTAVINGE